MNFDPIISAVTGNFAIGAGDIANRNQTPKREWIDLKDVQIEAASYHCNQSEGFVQGAKWAQRIIKELNK